MREKYRSVLVFAAAALAPFWAMAGLSIATPDSATPVERSAAAELQDAVERMTGARPDIVEERLAKSAVVLYVGATRAAAAATNEANVAEWRYDEVFIKSVPGGIVFTGHPVRGALYAVDEWLEKFCGVRWRTPFPIWNQSVVPCRVLTVTS